MEIRTNATEFIERSVMVLKELQPFHIAFHAVTSSVLKDTWNISPIFYDGGYAEMRWLVMGLIPKGFGDCALKYKTHPTT